MASYRVLVVDNADWIRERAKEELAVLGEDIVVSSAESVDEARGLLQSLFFNAAFVDLHLYNQSGISVVRDLNTLSPACRVFIMTRHLQEYAVEVLGLVGEDFRFEGLIDKVRSPEGAEAWFLPEVAPLVEAWRSRNVAIAGLDEIVGNIAERRKRIDRDLSLHDDLARLHSTEDGIRSELEHILCGIFGGAGLGLSDAEPRLDVSILRGGYSSSVVIEAAPSVYWPFEGRVVSGNRCVVKIGARPEILTEVRRYEQVVRFGVELHHRVEFLGYVSGDSLAGVCYSFAGGNSSAITSLDGLLDGGGEDWRWVLQRLFSPESRNWYSVTGRVDSLRRYFRSEFEISLERSLGLLEQWAGSLADRCPEIRTDDGLLRIADLDLTIPRPALLASKGLTSSVPACLVHGDMHGGNILIANGSEPCLIDFRNSGLGPRLIDFAALQASARFAHVRCWEDPPCFTPWPARPTLDDARSIAQTVFAERALLSGKDTVATQARWAEVDREISSLRSANFGDVTREELLWTSFAYCLSLARFVKMEWYRKLRLVAWLSALTEEVSTE